MISLKHSIHHGRDYDIGVLTFHNVCQVQLSDKIRELVDRNYWGTLKKLLKKGNQVKLPVGYELDNVNWISTFFDYLATDPTNNGGMAFELGRI